MKKYVLLSPKFEESIIEESVTLSIFKDHDFTPISIPKCSRLDAPVCTHPDMLFFKLSDGSVLTEGRYYDENCEFFASLPPELKIKKSKLTLAPKYPNDIAFDALKVGNTVFCLEKHTAPEILADSDKVVNIQQGYTKCSSLVIGSSVITADKGIHSAVTANGYDSLLISPEGIALDGYSCGFIGGASAVFEEEKLVIFFGNISHHPSYKEIDDFFKKKGYKMHVNANSPLEDQGGALLFCV